MTVFVRPAREEDSEIFTKWYINSSSFDPKFHLLETYTLVAFRKEKILGFLIVESREKIQILFCFVPNPENSKVESGLASSELVKTVITLGFTGNKPEIYFCGNTPGLNRIASRIFIEVPKELNTLFDVDLPVYSLNLKDL